MAVWKVICRRCHYEAQFDSKLSAITDKNNHFMRCIGFCANKDIRVYCVDDIHPLGKNYSVVEPECSKCKNGIFCKQHVAVLKEFAY